MMRRLWAAAVLVWRFVSALVSSAWTTSVIIVTASDVPHRRFAKFAYRDLNEPGVLLLAAMVSLTPGTSTVDIDTDRKELTLHVLDAKDLEATLSTIEHDFVKPIRILFGGRS